MQTSPQKLSRQHQYNSARVAITYLLHKPSEVKDALEPEKVAGLLEALIKKAEATELSLEEKKTLQELIKKR